MDRPKVKFFLDKKSFMVHSASLLFVLAAAFQIVGCGGLWSDRFFALTQIVLPAASFLLMVLFISALGEKALWASFIPFVCGLGFYGICAWFETDRIFMMIGIAFCVLALVLYLGTVFNLIRTKWLLVILFAVPFLYRAFYRDVILLQRTEAPVGFAEGMREMSLLCVLLAMTLLALGMKKRFKERRRREPEIPPAPPAAPVVPEPAPSVFTSASAPTPASVFTPAPAPAPVEPETQEPAESDV